MPADASAHLTVSMAHEMRDKEQEHARQQQRNVVVPESENDENKADNEENRIENVE